MLRIAICDDELTQIARIRTACGSYFATHADYTAIINSYDNPMEFLEALDQNGGCDIALLDVYIPGLSGIDTAREIRARHYKTEVIFLTSSIDYAVDAFALGAAHYLVKPFTQEQFDSAMERAISHLAPTEIKKLAFKTEDGAIRQVELNDILYIESAAHIQTIHLKTGLCTKDNRSLARITEDLEEISPGQFISPYKGYLVNLQAVVTIARGDITLSSGERIPLAKRSFGRVRDAYFSIIFKKMETPMVP